MIANLNTDEEISTKLGKQSSNYYRNLTIKAYSKAICYIIWTS